MSRKKTGPTTKPIRIPIRFEQQVKDYIARLKAGEKEELEPLPDRVIEELAVYAATEGAIGYAGIQVLRRYLLKDWLKKAIARFGFAAARERIQAKYGEKFAALVLPIPPKQGEWWEVLGVSPVASIKEVRRVHRELVLYWHPDRNSLPEAKAIAQAINRAWEEYKLETNRGKQEEGRIPL